MPEVCCLRTLQDQPAPENGRLAGAKRRAAVEASPAAPSNDTESQEQLPKRNRRRHEASPTQPHGQHPERVDR